MSRQHPNIVKDQDSIPLDLRQRRLLEWLENDNSDSLDILVWLDWDWPNLREETPHESVYLSLPPQGNSKESFAINTLRERISQVFTKLAENVKLRHQLNSYVWGELFALAEEPVFRDTKDPGIPTSLSHSLKLLLSAFDNDATAGKYPLEAHLTEARSFTSLIIHNQADNDLKDRWLTLIEEQVGREGWADPVLKIGLFGALGGLFAMPEMVDDDVIESALHSAYLRINKAQLSAENKNQLCSDLLTMGRNQFSRYQKKVIHYLEKIVPQQKDYVSILIKHVSQFRELASLTVLIREVSHPHAALQIPSHDMNLLVNSRRASLEQVSRPIRNHSKTFPTHARKCIPRGLPITRAQANSNNICSPKDTDDDDLITFMKQSCIA